MSVRRSLIWAFSGQFITFFVQFVGSLIIARLLSPHELGVFAIAVAAMGIAQIVATFGIASYLVREVDPEASMLTTAFTVNAILAAGLTIILTILSFTAGFLLGEANAGPVLRVIAIANLFGIFSFLPMALLQREMQFKRLSIITSINAATQTVGTILFALKGFSFMSPAYASIIAGIVTMIVAMSLAPQYIRLRFSTTGWRPIASFGLQMMSINGVGVLNGRLSDLLLGRLLGVASLGLYARASNLSGLIYENLYGTASRVVFVQLSRDYRAAGDWQATYLRGFAMISAFMWPLVIGLAVLSRPVIFILYGERWLSAALPLSALMIAQFIGIGYGMNWELFVLKGETRRQSRYEAMRLMFGIPLFAIGCLFNTLMAATAKIGDALIGLILYYPHVQRLAELGPRAIPRVYRDSAALTIVAVLPATMLMIAYDWTARIPLLMVASAVVVGIMLWAVLIVAIDHPLRNEFAFFLKKLKS